MKKITPFFTAVLSFMLGAFWYSDFFLGKLWKQSIEREINTDNIFMAMAISFILITVMAYGIQLFIKLTSIPSNFYSGFILGLRISIFFICTSLGIVYAYSGKTFFITLWAIDAGYQACFTTFMATILAKWR